MGPTTRIGGGASSVCRWCLLASRARARSRACLLACAWLVSVADARRSSLHAPLATVSPSGCRARAGGSNTGSKLAHSIMYTGEALPDAGPRERVQIRCSALLTCLRRFRRFRGFISHHTQPEYGTWTFRSRPSRINRRLHSEAPVASAHYGRGRCAATGTSDVGLVSAARQAPER